MFFVARCISGNQTFPSIAWHTQWRIIYHLQESHTSSNTLILVNGIIQLSFGASQGGNHWSNACSQQQCIVYHLKQSSEVAPHTDIDTQASPHFFYPHEAGSFSFIAWSVHSCTVNQSEENQRLHQKLAICDCTKNLQSHRFRSSVSEFTSWSSHVSFAFGKQSCITWPSGRIWVRGMGQSKMRSLLFRATWCLFLSCPNASPFRVIKRYALSSNALASILPECCLLQVHRDSTTQHFLHGSPKGNGCARRKWWQQCSSPAFRFPSGKPSCMHCM